MSNVLNYRGHHWIRCRREVCDGCILCDGGLAQCDRCGGAEAALPTHCPGERMTFEMIANVQADRLDYNERLGGWVNVGKQRGRGR